MQTIKFKSWFCALACCVKASVLKSPCGRPRLSVMFCLCKHCKQQCCDHHGGPVLAVKELLSSHCRGLLHWRTDVIYTFIYTLEVESKLYPACNKKLRDCLRTRQTDSKNCTRTESVNYYCKNSCAIWYTQHYYVRDYFIGSFAAAQTLCADSARLHTLRRGSRAGWLWGLAESISVFGSRFFIALKAAHHPTAE